MDCEDRNSVEMVGRMNLVALRDKAVDAGSSLGFGGTVMKLGLADHIAWHPGSSTRLSRVAASADSSRIER